MRRSTILWIALPLAAAAALGLALTLALYLGGPWGGLVSGPFGLPTPDGGGAPVREAAVDRPVFKAVREGERIILGGFVPEARREALVAAARETVAGAVVVDEMKAAAQVPPGLEEGALFGLRQLARLPNAEARVGAGTVSLSGSAPDSDTYTAIAAGAVPPAGLRLDVSALVPPPVRPYTWSAARREDGISLEGHVPSEAIRQALMAAARKAFPDRPVVERLTAASGLPAQVDFEAAARFALAQLALLHRGRVDLVDASLGLRGEVIDRDTLASLETALRSELPRGLGAGAVTLTLGRPTPYTFRARREGGILTLTGYYPDAETRAAIRQLVRDRFLTEQLVDKLRAADGAPRQYLAAVSFGLENLARLASGEAAVSDSSLRLTGEALYEQTAEQAARSVQALGLRGWTGTAEVRTRPSASAEAAQLRSSQP